MEKQSLQGLKTLAETQSAQQAVRDSRGTERTKLKPKTFLPKSMITISKFIAPCVLQQTSWYYVSDK